MYSMTIKGQLVTLLILIGNLLYGQDLRLGIEPGLRLSPMDRVMGPGIGLFIGKIDSKFSFLIKEDGIISELGIPPEKSYKVIFSTSLLVQYEVVSEKLHMGLGPTYVSRRNAIQIPGEKLGYRSISLFGTYSIRKFIFELRGAIHLGPNQWKVGADYGYLFPLTLAIHYHIDLSKNH